MPADRDLALSAPGALRRDLARRLGVAGFWRWWMENLSALVPAGPRAALERRRMRPVVAFAADRVTFWQPQLREGRIDLAEVASVALGGDAAAVTTEGRQALARLARGAAPPKVAVALPHRAVLRKPITLPLAVEQDLRQALAYDLDRHTPFKPEELYFDALVTERDAARGTIKVDLATALRTQVDAAVAQAQAWGAKVVAVTPVAPPALTNTTLNLLPFELRNGARFAKRWQFWLPIALLAAVALVAVVLPVWQKREYAIELNELAAQAMREAQVSETLRNELDRLVGDYNFALERKYAFPGTVSVLEDVTHILPDDTWLTQLEIKSVARGKEAQRDLAIRGESANAGRLVTLLEGSSLFTQAAPRSPTTKIQPGPGEIFDVGAQLKPLKPPSPIPLAALAAVPAAAPAAAGASAATRPAASPVVPSPGSTAKQDAVPAAPPPTVADAAQGDGAPPPAASIVPAPPPPTAAAARPRNAPPLLPPLPRAGGGAGDGTAPSSAPPAPADASNEPTAVQGSPSEPPPARRRRGGAKDPS